VFDERRQIRAVVHWQGGAHTELTVGRLSFRDSGSPTATDTLEIIRGLARQLPDRLITQVLNRLKIPTAKGHTWNEARVRAIRHGYQIAVYEEGEREGRGELNMLEAAREHLLLPQLEERFARQLGQGQERAVGQKHSFADQRVNMRVKMNQVSEGLDRPDHARHAIGPAAGRLVNGANRPPSSLTKGTQQRTIVTEVEAQSLGHGEHELAVRDFSANVFGDPSGFLQGAFLVAARTDTAPATGERDEHFVLALGTPYAREPLFEIAALQKLGDRRGDDRSPETITTGATGAR